MTLPPPAAPRWGGTDVDEVAALITETAGADSAAIEALEAVVERLRRAGRPRRAGYARADRGPSSSFATPRLGDVMTLTTRVTHTELQRAWRALEAGIFREEITPTPEFRAAANQSPAVETVFAGPVVVVAGCHGWAGTSTTALMVAEAFARRGTPVRILDAAPSARSGFPAAAATEHGLDETGRWRLGSRGRVAVHRSAGSPASVLEVPVPPAVTEGTVTVVDAGWPIAALLPPSPYAHWLPRSLRHSPLLLAARPSVPGLRHVEVTLELLPPSARPHVLLLGARRRWLQAASGELLLAAERDGRVHLVPEHGDLAATGLTPDPLPRQLHRVADHLTELTAPEAPPNPPVASRGTADPHDLAPRKDSPS